MSRSEVDPDSPRCNRATGTRGRRPTGPSCESGLGCPSQWSRPVGRRRLCKPLPSWRICHLLVTLSPWQAARQIVTPSVKRERRLTFPQIKLGDEDSNLACSRRLFEIQSGPAHSEIAVVLIRRARKQKASARPGSLEINEASLRARKSASCQWSYSDFPPAAPNRSPLPSRSEHTFLRWWPSPPAFTSCRNGPLRMTPSGALRSPPCIIVEGA